MIPVAGVARVSWPAGIDGDALLFGTVLRAVTQIGVEGENQRAVKSIRGGSVTLGRLKCHRQIGVLASPIWPGGPEAGDLGIDSLGCDEKHIVVAGGDIEGRILAGIRPAAVKVVPRAGGVR